MPVIPSGRITQESALRHHHRYDGSGSGSSWWASASSRPLYGGGLDRVGAHPSPAFWCSRYDGSGSGSGSGSSSWAAAIFPAFQAPAANATPMVIHQCPT